MYQLKNTKIDDEELKLQMAIPNAAPSFSDLYPERRGGIVSPSAVQRATGAGHPHSIKTQCERNVLWAIEEMPMVKTMVSALKVNNICVF